ILRISIPVSGIIEAIETPVKPAMCELHAFFSISIFTGMRWTFIECHDNIAANYPLDVRYIFRSKQMFTAIYMRLKDHSFLIYLPVIRKRENLVTPAIS